MIRKLLVCMSVCFTLTTLKAQTDPGTEINVIPPSPDVAALLKHIDFPVSHYTGTPQVSIPIYTVEMNSFSVPISLSYHASGLKVDEHASWVGAGWSLSAGGVISRTIRGLPDDLNDGFFDATLLFDQQTGLPDYTYINSTTCISDYGVLDRLNLNLLDGEADLFYYSFPGGNDKFYFKQDKTPVYYTPQDVVIEKNPFKDGADKWEVIDTKGIKYTFDKFESVTSDNACAVDDNPYSGSLSYKNTWHLTRIENPSSVNDEYVDFTYVSEIVSYDSRQAESTRFKKPQYSATNNASCYFTNLVTKQRLSKITTSNGITVDFNVKTPVRTDLPGSHALNEIVVSKKAIITGNPSTVLSFGLETSYFGTNTKLKLDEFFQFEPGDRTNKTNLYTFDYFSGSIPAVNSNNQDYWGYHNTTSNSSLLPEYKTDFIHLNQGGANRAPNLSLARRGTMQRINYPTGGYAEFTYELHDRYNADLKTTYAYTATASNGTQNNPDTDSHSFTVGANCVATLTISGVNTEDLAEIRSCSGGTCTVTTLSPTGFNRHTLPAGDYELYAENESGGSTSISIEYEQVTPGNEPVGGLRVEKVRYYDPVEQSDIVKKYTYTDETNTTQSSGLMFSNFLLTAVTSRYPSSVDQFGNCTDGVEEEYFTLSAVSNMALSTVQSSHIGYAHVREYVVANESTSVTDLPNVLGYTYFKFFNSSTPINTYPYVPHPDFSYKNGKLDESWQYGVHNSTFQPVRHVKNTYTTTTSDLIWNVKAKQNTTTDCGCQTYDVSNYTDDSYTIGTYWHRLDQTKETTWASLTSQDSSIITVDYYYENSNHHQSTRMAENLGTSTVETSFTRHSTINPLDPTETRWHVGLMEKKVRKVNGTTASGTETIYFSFLPREISYLDTKTTSTYILKSRISRDDYGNVIKVEDYPDDSGQITEYVWGYDDDLPVIRVVNPPMDTADWNTAESAALAAAGSNTVDILLKNTYDIGTNTSHEDKWRIFNHALRDHAETSDSQIFTYSYNEEGRISSITDPAGQTQYYVYDEFGRLLYIKDSNGHLVTKAEYNYKTTSN